MRSAPADHPSTTTTQPTTTASSTATTGIPTSASAPAYDAQSQASLALLLHQTILERDSWKEQAEHHKIRAERAEAVLQSLTGETSHDSEVLLQTQAQLDNAKARLANAEGRFRTLHETWDSFDKWQLDWERRVSAVRQTLGVQVANLCDSSFGELPLELAAHPPTPHLTAIGHGPIVNRPTLAQAGFAAEFPSLPPPPTVQPSTRTRVRAGSLDRDRDHRSKRPKSERSRVSEEPHSLYPSAPSAYELSHRRLAQDPSPSTSSVQLPGISTTRLGRSQPASSQGMSNTLPPIQQRMQYPEALEIEHRHHPEQPRLSTHDENAYVATISTAAQEQAKPHRKKTKGRGTGDAGDSDSEKSIDEMIMEISSTHTQPTIASASPAQRAEIGAQAQGHALGPSFIGTPPRRSAKNIGVTSPSSTAAPPMMYPATNAQGQRTCRQCGQAGRYKDGKCIEKWGPGPLGPGTVCDRCRKKMKRVERRGQLEAGLIPPGSSSSRAQKKMDINPDTVKQTFSPPETPTIPTPRSRKHRDSERMDADDDDDKKAAIPSSSTRNDSHHHRHTESKSTNQNSQSAHSDDNPDLDADAEADEDAEGEKEIPNESQTPGMVYSAPLERTDTGLNDEMDTDRWPPRNDTE